MAAINVGDIVKIQNNAVYYTGRQMSTLIKSKEWIVERIAGDRVFLGKSADGYYTLNAPVAMRFLSKVEGE